MVNIIDDMEHRVRKVIAEHRDEAGFPKLEDYGVSEEDFDDYMFYKQAIIDDVESLRKKYTIYSIIFFIQIHESVFTFHLPDQPFFCGGKSCKARCVFPGKAKLIRNSLKAFPDQLRTGRKLFTSDFSDHRGPSRSKTKPLACQR